MIHRNLGGTLLRLALVLIPAYVVFPTGSLAQVDFTIRAKVDEEAGKLLIQPSNYCNNDNSAGCMDMEDFTLIRFRLAQSDGWSFTRVFICEGDTKPNPSDCSMGKLERLQFVASRSGVPNLLLPNVRGLINLRPMLPSDPQSEDMSVFFLYNANNTPRNYFYMLEACKGGGNTTCVRTDPPLRNRGRRS